MAELVVRDSDAMDALGAALADRLRAPVVMGLSGPLGAGKTTLVRGFLHRLGHSGPVRSPTYTLVETYALAGGHVHHLDLYRVADAEELEFIGVRDLATADAIWLIEWPERGAACLPPLDWRIAIAFDAAAGRRVHGVPPRLSEPDTC